MVGLVYALANTLVASVLGSLSRLAPSFDNFLIWTLSGTIICLALSPFIMHSSWSRLKTIFAVWAVLAFIRTLGLGIEGVLFMPTTSVNGTAGAIFGLLVSLMVAWVAVILLLPRNRVPIEGVNPERGWWGWTWRVLVIGLVYFAVYFIFGATNAYLYTMDFYKNNPQYGLNLSAPEIVFLAQLVKGPLFALGLLFIAQSVNLSPRRIGVWLGVLLFVVGGLAPYVEITFRNMPLGFNMATLAEIFLQAFLRHICIEENNKRKKTYVLPER